MPNVVGPSGLFSYTAPQTGQLENLASRALARGVDLFIEKKYDEAIREYQRAVSLAPNTGTAVSAYNQIAQAYTQQNDKESAIKAYQQSLRLDPNQADTRIALGNIYYFDERFPEAQQEYEQAVRLDPSASNRFSLGQAYLANDRVDDAEYQFRQVRTMAPNQPSGEYGLGLVYAKEGRGEDAIQAFQAALDVQRDFWDAYAEMGYVYADTGQMDEATSIANKLLGDDATLGATLTQYITEKTPPEMISVLSSGSFPASLGPGTQVSLLGTYLTSAEGSQTFSMVFQFNKQMDQASVENVLNWQISRSVGTGLGDNYNYGLEIPSTEVSLSPHPVSVYYDTSALTATVWFDIRQNASADGTLDLSHVQFTFAGKDRFGLGIDAKADQYTGFSGFA